VVAFALADSPYLLIGFEDMYNGGDLDYNDLLFAVDIGEANVASLPGVPEPATSCMLFSYDLCPLRGNAPLGVNPWEPIR